MQFVLLCLLSLFGWLCSAEDNKPKPIWNTARFESDAFKELGECNAADLSPQIRKIFGLDLVNQYKFSDYTEYINDPANQRTFTELNQMKNNTPLRNSLDEIRTKLKKVNPKMLDLFNFYYALMLKSIKVRHIVMSKVNFEIMEELVNNYYGKKGEFSDLPQDDMMAALEHIIKISNALGTFWADIEGKTPIQLAEVVDLIEKSPIVQVNDAYQAIAYTISQWIHSCLKKSVLKSRDDSATTVLN